MMGKHEELTCPCCNSKFSVHLGITTYYEILKDPNKISYYKQTCKKCGKEFLANEEKSIELLSDMRLIPCGMVAW